jgi:hypothetical protein
MGLVRLRSSNPSPQSSPLAKGRGETTVVELKLANTAIA